MLVYQRVIAINIANPWNPWDARRGLASWTNRRKIPRRSSKAKSPLTSDASDMFRSLELGLWLFVPKIFVLQILQFFHCWKKTFTADEGGRWFDDPWSGYLGMESSVFWSVLDGCYPYRGCSYRTPAAIDQIRSGPVRAGLFTYQYLSSLNSSWLQQISSFKRMSICLFVYLSISLSIYSIYLYIYLSIHRPIHRSIDPSVDPSIHLFIDISIYPSIHLSIYPSIHLSIYPSIQLSIVDVPLPCLIAGGYLLGQFVDG